MLRLNRLVALIEVHVGLKSVAIVAPGFGQGSVIRRSTTIIVYKNNCTLTELEGAL